MHTTRRDVLGRVLFGAGAVGLKAMATGLPIWAFTRPVRAWAQEQYTCSDKTKAQYLILSTSDLGDPLNANTPGTYDHQDIVHAADPSMEPVMLSLGGKMVMGARLWSALPQNVLDRTSFFHHGTYTNNHPNLPKVLRLMGATSKQEMLPSILAKHLAPCMTTVQTEPVSVGAGEILTFEGRGLPNLAPTGLRDVLTQTEPQGMLAQLRTLRDRHIDKMHQLLKQQGTISQRAFLDRVALSRTQARKIADDLLKMLSAINSNRADGQILAAAILCKMNVSPVIAIKIPFGSDNHVDNDLMTLEVPQSKNGVQTVAALMTTLKAYGLEDRVTFAMYNVFGRTLKKLGTKGRDHWAGHHVTVMIGKAIKGGVVGGLEPKAGDYYATPIDSGSGASAPGGGDIPFDQTLAAMGKTLGAALGVDRGTLDKEIKGGKVVAATVA